jgi:CO/xanthine dehydrogenase FAD-binding subunit
MGSYLQPDRLAEALRALAADGATVPNDRLTVVAGATDFYPAETTRQAWFQPTPRHLLDISGIKELHGLTEINGTLRIGAMATWSELLAHPLSPAFDALKQASRQVGGVQIQNRGTLVGNICNASPAADGMPPLLTLDAVVEIASRSGVRTMPLTSFVLGNRKTALKPGEMVTALIVPMPDESETSVFLKLGARSYLVISIVSVAANLMLDQAGRIKSARIAVGSCSAVPQRLSLYEERLLGVSLQDAVELLHPNFLHALNPLDDVRASAAYRKEAALTLVGRAFGELIVKRTAKQRQAA